MAGLVASDSPQVAPARTLSNRSFLCVHAADLIFPKQATLGADSTHTNAVCVWFTIRPIPQHSAAHERHVKAVLADASVGPRDKDP